LKLKAKEVWTGPKPYVDTFITDTYGTAVGIINPDAPYKVVIEGHGMKFHGTLVISLMTD
jgi:hypothetical protein